MDNTSSTLNSKVNAMFIHMHHFTIVKALKWLLIIATLPFITKVRVSNVSDSERCWLLQSSHGS